LTVFLGIIGFSCLKIQYIEAEPSSLFPEPGDIALAQGNSIMAVSAPAPEKVVREIPMVVTAYSSTVWETDDDPFTTASGTKVRDGIVANNFLPLGTEIRIPELYGDKIFVVEDRMNWRKSNYHLDVWFPEYKDALNFGAKRTYIEVLES
jgi:3D (Asp-Asp-Asp) domain-containing protein